MCMSVDYINELRRDFTFPRDAKLQNFRQHNLKNITMTLRLSFAHSQALENVCNNMENVVESLLLIPGN